MAQDLLLAAESVPGMERVEERLWEAVSSPVGFLGQVMAYLLESGGKRLRPMLVLLSGSLHACDLDLLVDAAVAAELIHMASLVHDDIIDGSHTRRGRRSVNARWGEKVSVLTGDFLFARALSILCLRGATRLVEVMANAIIAMCEGEIQEISGSFNPDLTEADYLERIYKKTAYLIGASCYAGTIVNGASEFEASSMREYGLELGYAFQIIDDILDFSGEAEALGKPVGKDLSQGILTLPVIRALNDPAFYKRFAERLRGGLLTSVEIREITAYLRDSGAIEYAYSRAQSHVNAAKGRLSSLPDTFTRRLLQELADTVISRTR